MSVILRRTLPPNVPKGAAQGMQRTVQTGLPTSAESASPPSGGEGFTIAQMVQRPPYDDAISELVAAAGSRSAVVVAPTVVEVEAIADRLVNMIGDRVVIAHSSLSARDATRAWVRGASEEGACVVGTREVVLWPVRDLGTIGVVEDARRVMRSPSTPTLGVREIMVERARHAKVPITFVGALPSLEVLARRPTVSIAPGRRWPLVEVADRREEPPTASPVLDRTRAAIAHAVRQNEPAIVLVGRRGHAATIYCASCGEHRRCRVCGAAASTTEACARCEATFSACVACGSDRWRSVGAGRGNVIEDLRRVVGDKVGDRESASLVTVGTERDLIGITGMALAVAIDVDGMAFAPNYRAGEDALRLLIRLAMTLEPGRGRRTLLQTADPGQPVIEALRTGDPSSFLSNELAARKRSGFPPFGQLIALEVSTGDDTVSALVQRDISPLATVRGPATVGDRQRWLIHGTDLGDARIALRQVTRTLRDRGAKVRIDVDPIDL